MFSRFLHIVAYIKIPFFFLAILGIEFKVWYFARQVLYHLSNSTSSNSFHLKAE
jgi:hypothetical protein